MTTTKPKGGIRRTPTKRQSRGDSWRNLATGVGVNHGKNRIEMMPTLGDYLDVETIARIYELDGLGARIVDAFPKHALRRPPTLKTKTPETSAALTKTLVRLGAWSAFRSGWRWGRCFGGGGIVVGADDGLDPALPLQLDRLRAVRFLVVADRRFLIPQTWINDSFSPDYGKPETYLLQRVGGTASETTHVHHSRVIRFEGEATTIRRQRELRGWGESVLQRCYSELQGARGAFAASGTLLQEASVGVLKMKGLMKMIAADPGDLLKKRFEVMDLMRGVARAMMVDADGEDFTRTEVGALTGVVELVDRFTGFLSAVSGIPVTVLMGQAPAGLNATGDADMRNWYDEVAASREEILSPAIERLCRMILLSKEGPTRGVAETVTVTYPSLWQETPKEAADRKVALGNLYLAAIDKQALTPEEVALGCFGPDGWQDDLRIDPESRRVVDEGEGDATAGDPNAPGADHAEGIAAVLDKVGARQMPRDAGVALLAASFGMPPATADMVMGETGRTFFTAPEPGHAEELATLRAENARLVKSNRGHQQYTARVIQAAKDGGVELGPITSAAPTATAEGDDLEPGDVVEVPVEEGEAA